MNIKVNSPCKPFTTQIVTFTAPCNCDEVTDGLSINGEIYTVCDAMGECVTGKGGAWCAGAQISVVLDCENKKAFIQNKASGTAQNTSITAELADEIGSDPNVENALSVINSGLADALRLGIYAWRLSSLAEDGYVMGELGTFKASGAGDYLYSAEIAVENNKITLVNPSTVHIKGWLEEYVESAQVLKGMFFDHSSSVYSQGVMFVPADADIKFHDGGSTGASTIWIPCHGITAFHNASGVLDTVFSTDINAYPKDETVNGVYYEFLGDRTADLMNFGARIQTGSYVGTGTYGKNNPSSLTFEFAPKWVYVYGSSGSSSSVSKNVDGFSMMFADWMTTDFKRYAGLGSAQNDDESYAKKSEDGKTFTWYNTDSVGGQHNGTNTHYWIAIG